MAKIPMTADGAEALRAEVSQLKSVERPRIVQAISEALAQGDLRENAEFQYAKEEQGFIEGRILEIENKLASAQIIDIKTIPSGGRVIFGTTVSMLNLDNDEE
jgi:transcription elongation factor GreA